MFKTHCDKNDIAERAPLIILPNFLAGTAETTYLNEVELGNEGFGGFSSYCHAVHFLLRCIAADRYIDRAVEDFESVRQKDEEDETTYAQRLRANARCFGAVYPETHIITRFIRVLDPTLRPQLSSERNARLRGFRTFYDTCLRIKRSTTGSGQKRSPPPFMFVNVLPQLYYHRTLLRTTSGWVSQRILVTSEYLGQNAGTLCQR